MGELRIRPTGHIISSGVIGFILACYFRSLPCGLVFILAGTLIDLDHISDYYVNRKFTFNFKRIYSACEDMSLDTLYLVMHSYELVALLWALIVIFSLGKVWVCAASGITVHLLVDQVTNPVRPLAYFFTYRWINKFESDKFLIRKKGR